jgi:hypothetical protein
MSAYGHSTAWMLFAIHTRKCRYALAGAEGVTSAELLIGTIPFWIECTTDVLTSLGDPCPQERRGGYSKCLMSGGLDK